MENKKHIFFSSLEPFHAQYQQRLWLADALDLALGLLIGWACVRFYDLGSHPGQAALVMAGAWVAYATFAGMGLRTFWRWVLGVRLSARGARPGPLRAFARAFTLLPDHVGLALFRARSLDRLLGLRPEADPGLLAFRLRGLPWQLHWLATAIVALHFIITPTRSEALKFLNNTLDGWRCCHGQLHGARCTRALVRVASDARGQDADAVRVVSGCPEAALDAPAPAIVAKH